MPLINYGVFKEGEVRQFIEDFCNAEEIIAEQEKDDSDSTEEDDSQAEGDEEQTLAHAVVGAGNGRKGRLGK